MHDWLLSLPSAERNLAHSDHCAGGIILTWCCAGVLSSESVITGSVEKISPIAQRPSRNVHPDKSTGLVRDFRTCTHSSFTLSVAEARAMRPATLRHGQCQIQIKFTTVGVLGEDNSLRLTFPLRILVSGKKANGRSFGSILDRKTIAFHPRHQPLCKTVIYLSSLRGFR